MILVFVGIILVLTQVFGAGQALSSDADQLTKAVVDGLKDIHFAKRREQYRKGHEMEFNIHFAAKRTLDRMLKDAPDKALHIRAWKEEAERLSAEYAADYEELKKQREESKELFRIQAEIDSVLREQEHIRAQQDEQKRKQETTLS